MEFAVFVVAAVLIAFFASAVRVLREYERGVVFQLGRFWKVKGPGLIIIVPVVQQMVRVDLRTVVMDVPSQDVISRDNVSVKVSAVIYFRVIDPQRAIIQVESYAEATSQLAQTTLRSVLGQHELDEMLAEREKLNADIQQILDQQTDAWGIKVSNVEIKHIDLDESMIRAIARQAEAERERRAKVIHAEGELQASVADRSADSRFAAAVVAAAYLQTLTDIATDKIPPLCFMPMDLIGPFQSLLNKVRARASRGRGHRDKHDQCGGRAIRSLAPIYEKQLPAHAWQAPHCPVCACRPRCCCRRLSAVSLSILECAPYTSMAALSHSFGICDGRLLRDMEMRCAAHHDARLLEVIAYQGRDASRRANPIRTMPCQSVRVRQVNVFLSGCAAAAR